ncbi:MAG TPA: oligosaccharide flippase family protein [Alphaproteobacteria bacterium]|nr:oligosaccharide flippase family protein [Alphaproteobacteria bacterium]
MPARGLRQKLTIKLHKVVCLNGFWHLLPRGSFIWNVLVLSGGTALGYTITLLTSPVLTRLYTAEDFGIWGVFAALLSSCMVIASLRYEIAISLSGKEEDVVGLQVLSLSLVLGMGLLIGFVVLLIGGHIVEWVNVLPLRNYLWLLPIGLIAGGFHQVFSYWAVRKRWFPHLARIGITQNFTQVLIQTSLGVISHGPGGLVLGLVGAQLVGIGSLGTLAWRESRDTLKKLTLRSIRDVALRYRRFPLFSSGSALINNLGLQLPMLLLAAFYGSQVAGWFGLGQRVLGIPLTFLGNSIAKVYIGEASRLKLENPALLRRLVLQTTFRLFVICILPMMGLALGGAWLFTFIFGETWRESGRYVQILSIPFTARLIVVPLSQTLNILDRQDLQLFWDVFRVIVVVVTILIPFSLRWSSFQAILTYGIGTLGAYILLFIISNNELCKMQID